MKKLFANLSFVGLIVAITSGCSSNTAEWREEVKLLDGRVITITQMRRFESAYAGGPLQMSLIVREAWIRLKLPELGDQEIVWHENLIPKRLDVWKGDLIVVGYPPTAFEFDKYGKPVPAYIGFKYARGGWLRLKFEEIPKDIYVTNLVIKERLPAGMTFLSLPEKESRQFNGDPYLSRSSKTIVPDFGKSW